MSAKQLAANSKILTRVKKLRRRVFFAEQCELVGLGKTRLIHIIKLGRWPQQKHDPGSKRGWLWDNEVEAALTALENQASTEPVSVPASAPEWAEKREAGKRRARRERQRDGARP